MRKLFMISFAAYFLAQTAAGQTSAPVVQARLLLSADAVHAGSSAQIAAVATIASGYHINDHKPTLDYLIPTELQLDSGKELKIADVAYPKGTPVKFEFSDQALSVYQGHLVVKATVRVAPGAPPGTYQLQGKLAYQACNDHACLAPTSVPLALGVKVVAAGVAVKRVNSDVFSPTQSVGSAN